MPLAGWLQKAEKLEIETYRKAKNPQELQKTHVSFSGLPKKHPLLSDRVVLIPDPLSTSASYLEFRSKDISFVEELPSLVNEEGDVFTMTRIWVKKDSVAIRSTPFLVNDIWKV
jgi:inorganic pyrophosphatase